MALEGRREESIAKMNKECRPLLAALLKTTHEYIEYEHIQANVTVDSAASAYKSDRALLSMGCVVAHRGSNHNNQ